MRAETPLDYATFQLHEAKTRCELWITAGNETEKLASGSLKPFLVHLQDAQDQISRDDDAPIMLQVPSVAGNGRKYSATWFTKGTMERFVRFVTTPEILERVSAVETERQQLEDAINILAAESSWGDDQASRSTSSTPGSGSRAVRGLDFDKGGESLKANQDSVEDADTAGENSKRQLLRAMDARKIMLQKEQAKAFARANAAGFDLECMADLVEFASCFGAPRLKEACLRFAVLCKKRETDPWLQEVDFDGSEALPPPEHVLRSSMKPRDLPTFFHDNSTEIKPLETLDFTDIIPNEDFSSSLSPNDSNSRNSRVRRTWGIQDKSTVEYLLQSKVETSPDTNEDSYSGGRILAGSNMVQRSNAQTSEVHSRGSIKSGDDILSSVDMKGSKHGFESDQLSYERSSSGFGTPDKESPGHDSSAPVQFDSPTSRRMLRRSMSPRRRSASPMRKVQIGRAGGLRRPGMVVIRNINYMNANLQEQQKSGKEDENDKTSEGTASEEESDSTIKSRESKEDTNRSIQPDTRRLSVQDAISLFERKQKDSQEAQKTVSRPLTQKGALETPDKAVLRRWSGAQELSSEVTTKINKTQGSLDDAGISKDSKKELISQKSVPSELLSPALDAPISPGRVKHKIQELIKDDSAVLSSKSAQEERRKSWVPAQTMSEHGFRSEKPKAPSPFGTAVSVEKQTKDLHGSKESGSSYNLQAATFGFQKTFSGHETFAAPRLYEDAKMSPLYRAGSLGETTSSKGPLSKSWTAPLVHDMPSFIKEVDSSPVQFSAYDQQGRFYEQYREKRDAKLRQESGLKRAEREAKLRAMQEILETRKAELVAGASRIKAKDEQDKSIEDSKLQNQRRAPVHSSPVVSNTGRPSKQQLPDPKSTSIRKLSPSSQKPAVTASNVSSRTITSSPKSIAKSSNSGGISSSQRRSSGYSHQTSTTENPLSRSMPSLAELRKENTKPSAGRSGPTSQQSKSASTKRTQSKSTIHTSRNRAANKVMPLEANGVVSDSFPEEKKSRGPTARKKAATTELKGPQASAPDSDTQCSPREQTSKINSTNLSQDTKPFLRKGRGIGPGAGPGVLKLKAAVIPDVVKTDEEDNLSSPSTRIEDVNIEDSSIADINPDDSSNPLSGAEDLEDRQSESSDALHFGVRTLGIENTSGIAIPVPREESNGDLVIARCYSNVASSSKHVQILSGFGIGGHDSSLDMISSSSLAARSKEEDGTLQGVQVENGAYAQRRIMESQGTPPLVSPSKRTLFQHITHTDDQETGSFRLSSPSQLTFFSQITSSDRRASLASVGSSSPCASPVAKNLPQLQHSISPNIDAVKLDYIQSRKKWGDSEKPQQVQKDHAKGFKRLLKFGRKSRGSGNNSSDWVSVSTTSEGDDDTEYLRDKSEDRYSTGKSILRKSAETLKDDGVSSNVSKSSFFSLSSFRSKSSDSKSRS